MGEAALAINGRAERFDAKCRGDKTYFTGTPCRPFGHVCVRVTKTGVCVECNKARLRRWNEKNKERVSLKWVVWNEAHPESRRAAGKRYYEKNREMMSRISAARQSRVKQATPPWADLDAIEDFYKSCPRGCAVDHVIPVSHSRVCGLHIPANMQYLSKRDNREKWNFFVPGDPMIYTMIPWDDDGNLGRAYNQFMELLPEEAWACFKDHDCITTTNQWNMQFAEAIAFLPEAGAFVATTNRIASDWQRRGDPEIDDMNWHRRYGTNRLQVRTLLDISDTKGFGGVMFCVSKKAWREVGGFADGLGCVDHSLHFRLQKIGRKVYLVEGLYVYHWRHKGEPDPTSKFPKAANCQCRGPEIAPSQRIEIPRLSR